MALNLVFKNPGNVVYTEKIKDCLKGWKKNCWGNTYQMKPEVKSENQQGDKDVSSSD